MLRKANFFVFLFVLFAVDCGIYVDMEGHLTREVYLFWPSRPLSHGFAYHEPLLHVFTEAGLFVFDVETSTWVASAAGSRRLRPLNCSDAHLCLMSHASNPAQGLSKLANATATATATTTNVGSASGGAGSGSAGGGALSGTANASLVYLPPPRQSVFGTAQRRRTNTSIFSSSTRAPPLGCYAAAERRLELDSAALLDANTRVRVSPTYANCLLINKQRPLARGEHFCSFSL